MLEGATNSPTTSPTKSPERLQHRQDRSSTSTPTPNPRKEKEPEIKQEPDDFEDEPISAGPAPGPSLTPIIRPTVRRSGYNSILGENTPPQSSTMLALQTMGSQTSRADSEPPLSNVTNGSTAVAKPTQSFDHHLSTQIVSLTTIATALQKEMSALSRRSRDNATDLLSLKEATNTRDEDIRKSLRDLLGSVNETSHKLGPGNSFGSLLLDNKPHNAHASNSRGFQLPRIPSPNSFTDSIERGSISTPSLVGSGHGDSSQSIVLLEKIIRDMGTKEGHDTLVSRLTEVSSKLSGMATAAKIDELVDQVRTQSESAIIPSGPNVAERQILHNEGRRSSAPARGAEMLNEELIKIIRSVKDSVAHGGGLTSEVKALVRELRGEVLGMGRELGKRLEQVGNSKSIEESDNPSKDDVSRVIDQGLEQMKDQLNHVLREHRRQSAQSTATAKSLVDYQEIYNAMRAALRDNEASESEMPDLSRDDVIEAVRDAWETYKPEIEIQQVGLERDEVLACLTEGLQDYTTRNEQPSGATRDEVFTAVVEGLKHFVPPQMDTPSSMSRDEIIEAVRDCLEEFEFPVAASAVGQSDLTREDMIYAVKEGLEDMDLPRGAAMVPHSGSNEELVTKLEDLVGYIKLEFKAVSQEAKDNVAANGRDTEQVLDATKDGLENLRIAIEGYVDRASGEAGQEEFMQGLLKTMDEFKEDVSALVSQSSDASREQLQTELEGLREIVNSSMVPAMPQQSGNNKEILEALHTAANNLQKDILRPKAETTEILDALNEGLNEIKEGIDRMTNKPVDLTANDEILDALKSGLDSVRSDIETVRESSNDKVIAMAAVPKESAPEQAIIPADMVKQDDIKALEVLITQLRIKVEAMEPPEQDAENVHKEDLTRLEGMLQNIQQGVEEIGSRETHAAAAKEASAEDAATVNTDAATKDDVEAIETILRNTKCRLDDLMDGEQAVRKEHLDVVEALILETRENMSTMTEGMESISRKDDLSNLESLITQIKLDFEEMKEKTNTVTEDTDKVSKTDVEAVETVVLEIKNILDVFQGVDFNALPQKEDIANIETLITEAKEKIDSFNESSSTAITKKDEEMGTVGDRVTEVKTFLEELQETLKGKLDDGSTGIEALGKLLETMGEKMDKNENVGTDLKEMFETMKTEFEDSRGVVAGAKLESDEKLQQTSDSISTKIDDKITELIVKYDEFQSGFDEKMTAGEARSLETEEAVVGTKAVADELKLLVDTLGSSVTDSLEKMEEASRTVFGKVEELATQNGENHTDGKAEHQQTRGQLQDAVTLVESLKGEVSETNPMILQAISEVLALVGQHYEHSKTSTTDIQDKIVEAKPSEQPLLEAPEKYDDSEVQQKLDRLVELKYDDTDVREKLDLLAGIKYDDSVVNEKLDKLVTHSDSAEQKFEQLETLDKVHQTVAKTAADISDFLSNQTQRIADEHEDREKTLQDTIVHVERTRAEKDHLAASILSLKDEEERLRAGITGLRTEQESLIRQKTRLTGDVSSLETAMRLRKEELSDMELRAERLERRIVDGVMDHSRVLLMSKATKSQGGDSMNRKRVRKPSATEDTPSARPSPKPAMNMALAGKRNLAPSGQTGTARRIASLGQINNNLSSGGVKRSQSVRTPAGGGASKAYRKRSWGGDSGMGGMDKENLSVKETVEEVDENESPALIEPPTDTASEAPTADDQSDTDTLRRSSAISGSTGLYTESEFDETASEWTESVVSSSVAATNGGLVGEGDVVVYGQ